MIEKEAYVRKLYSISLEPNTLEIESLAWFKHTYFLALQALQDSNSCFIPSIYKLKLQYFGHLMQKVDSLEKTLMLGGIGGSRRSGQ